jgi:hypothetical protein
MRASIVRMCSPRGLHIPEALLAACGTRDEVELSVVDGRLIAQPVPSVRTGWAAVARATAKRGENHLLDPPRPRRSTRRNGRGSSQQLRPSARAAWSDTWQRDAQARPCAVISPDEMNQALRTVVVARMTAGGHAYSELMFRVGKSTDEYETSYEHTGAGAIPR